MDRSKEDYKIRIFTGTDESDLNRKVWEWQTKNLVTIIETHPDEHLPLNARPLQQFSKLEDFPDPFSKRVDFLQH